MVQGPTAVLSVRDAEEQLHSLSKKLKALNPEHALEWLLEHKRMLPAACSGFAAVSRIEHFGALRIPATSGVWYRATEWAIHTRIPGVAEGAYMRFDERAFSLEERTRKAFSELEQQSVLVDKSEQNPFRLFPIRFSTEEKPVLQDGEFFLDLASLMWLLASHRGWRPLNGELLFRCLGERHADGGTILVGYADSARKLTVRDNPSAQYPVVIGKVL